MYAVLAGRILLIGTLFFSLSGCTKPPQIPALPGTEAHNSDTFILGDRLSSADIRRIFKAINKNGALDPLRPFFESPTDGSLQAIGNLLDRYIYKPVNKPWELPQLLRKRISQSDLSRFRKYIDQWGQESDFSHLIDASLFIASHPKFPALFERDVFFLAPRFANLAAKIQNETSYREKHDWESRSKPNGAAWVQDIYALVKTEKNIADLTKLGKQLQSTSFGNVFFNTLVQLKSQFDHSANGPVAFEGFAYGLRKLLTTKPDNASAPTQNKLALLAKFAERANQGTDGLFLKFAQVIDRQPDIFFSLTRQFVDPLIVDAVFRNIQKNFVQRTDWQAFFPMTDAARKVVTQKISSGLLKIQGFGDSFISSDPFPEQWRRQIPAYALSLWLEKVLTDNQEALGKALNNPDPTAIWDTTIQGVELEIEFISQDAAGLNTFPQHAAMIFRQLDPNLVSQFEKYMAQGFLPDFFYQFSTEQNSLKEAFIEAIEQVNETLPLGNAAVFINALASYAASPKDKLIASFEVNNIFDSLNRALAVTPPDRLQLISKLVFEKAELGTTPWENNGAGLSTTFSNLLDGDPKLMTLVKALTEASQPIYYFDKPPASAVPSPMQSYLALLQNSALTKSPHSPIRSVTELLSFIGRNELFEAQAKADKRALIFPAIGGTVDQARAFAETLHKLSLLEANPFDPYSEQAIFLEALSHALGTRINRDPESGLELHAQIAKALIEAKPSSSTALADRLTKESWSWLSDQVNLSNDERRWLLRFASSGDHLALWELITSNFDRGKSLKFVQKLRELIKEGLLRRAFELLGHLDDSRLQKVADLLLLWETSGELDAFLSSLQTLLQPSLPPIKQPPLKPVERFIEIQNRWEAGPSP